MLGKLVLQSTAFLIQTLSFQFLPEFGEYEFLKNLLPPMEK